MKWYGAMVQFYGHQLPSDYDGLIQYHLGVCGYIRTDVRWIPWKYVNEDELGALMHSEAS